MSNQNLKVDHKTVIEEFKRKYNFLVDALENGTVHKMSAPTSAILTDEQIEQIIDGVFLEGELLSRTNMVLFPGKEYTTYYTGIYITTNEVGAYQITKSSKVIGLIPATSHAIDLRSINQLNGKIIPDYPASDVNKYLKSEQGTLKWEDINLEDIVDSQGNKRFPEGDIEIETITGVTKVYGKWSLSATHLMIVLSITIENATEIASDTKLCNVNLPDWIINKIQVLYPGTTRVSFITSNAYATGGTGQAFNAYLRKANDKIDICKNGAITMTAERTVRLEFDLLIDTDAPVSAGE